MGPPPRGPCYPGSTSVKCADPVLCYIGPTGKKIYRNFSYAPHVLKQAHNQVFDCGKCLHCRKKRAYELACRCVLHASLYKQNCFLTLTYDEKKDGYHNNFEYSDIQKFKKRLRRHCEPKRIEIFNVHEYGKNGKKHWHLIVFNHDFNDKTLHTVSNGTPLYTSLQLERLWPMGFNTIGDVSGASAMYTAQYVNKDFKNNNVGTIKKSHSKHAGIGRPYFLLHYKQILSLGYVPVDGKKLPVPRYFQRLAHKHYCHFNEPSAFWDTKERKALYRPFRKEEPSLEISELYKTYDAKKRLHIEEKTIEWQDLMKVILTEKLEPDFIKSNSNALYDLQNKNKPERF